MKKIMIQNLRILLMLYASNETNLCNEDFSEKEAREEIQVIGLLPEFKFSCN